MAEASRKASLRGWRTATAVLAFLLVCVIVVGITVPLVYRNRLYKVQVEMVAPTTPLHYESCGSLPCVSGVGTCLSLADGSYTCLCAPGFTGPSCDEDIDECSSDADNCDYYSTSCRNTFGSFRCQCKTGFSPLTQRACQDTDECSSGSLNGCDNATTVCWNTFGSYGCSCRVGFTNLKNQVCADVDECSAMIDNCDKLTTTCINTIGSFVCPCLMGYARLNNRQCITVDTCASNPCLNGATCQQHTVGYSCLCSAGWTDSRCATQINECASNPCLNGANCTDQLNGFSCSCPINFIGSTCSMPVVSRIAFCAVRQNDYVPLDQCPVLYDKVTINDGNFYSLCNGQFTPPQDGVYLFHLSVDAPSQTGVSVNVKGVPYSFGIFSNQTKYTGAYTLSRDALLAVNANQPISLTTSFPQSGDGLTETGWAAFKTDAVTGNSPVMFSVASSGIVGSAGRVSFDTILINKGSSWKNDSSSFITPQSGIYLFAYSLGLLPSSRLNANIAINGSSICASSWNSITQEGDEQLSRFCIQPLGAGVNVSLQTDGPFFSNSVTYATSFSGLLFNPNNPENQVAWYVQRTNAETTGNVNNLGFDQVLVNAGSNWDTVTQQVTIDVPGVYYLRLDAQSCFSAPLNVTVNRNNNAIFSVQLQFRLGDGGVSLGRAAVVELRRNDYITVSLLGASCVLGGSKGQTAFSGFLIYPR